MDAPAGQPGWVISVLLLAISVLSGVVAFLFRTYNKHVTNATRERREHDKALSDKDIQFAKEREAWVLERASWEHTRELERAKDVAEYEQKHREILERVDQQMQHERAMSRSYVDQVRKESSDQVEVIAQKAQEAAERTAQVLDKIYDRFLSGPRNRRNF